MRHKESERMVNIQRVDAVGGSRISFKDKEPHKQRVLSVYCKNSALNAASVCMIIHAPADNLRLTICNIHFFARHIEGKKKGCLRKFR